MKKIVILLVWALALTMAAHGYGLPMDAPNGWRAIAVAGDDSAEVFDNAVTKMGVILAARGVAPINRFTSDPMLTRPALPLATAAAISETLAAAPAQAGEGCLFFITSHGGRNGVLLRDDLASKFVLTPATLARMLDRGCGKAPTVAIVSACFSGVFISDVTKAPNRIILTAARPDRTSFGCGHEEQFTYFDGCMFQAWPDAKNWRGLFQTIKACVLRKEDALRFRHSEPQAYFGAAVKDLGLP
jgi:hypothetical protein